MVCAIKPRSVVVGSKYCYMENTQKQKEVHHCTSSGLLIPWFVIDELIWKGLDNVDG